ncbi:tRNA lysidine(34) synthetase TilS [Candidatus Lucifugimonas marina]|uniref:tRNA(Ile)-lysidine synthase n=1 Tax=Candidatus Lucifugimonas marina TaxID=3038979 RepID=A0AAJ5ZFK7_9CHLR|nr:tRNA lysidine(34) synthetase TilS [SAR202 cluster bacterium JH702]MDG0870071.1 tRNA lysidine(34) synthetase TilS [SAR202 cluster bacterium JH639]WFG36366.1 tRNA lysidine(34) synthetase TilS [SAR202 cluster bacterium JH545]WFG40299.1 tRNA lysidine(34) synthetase TilS [SAR202 cluster bacterium JH1073]
MSTDSKFIQLLGAGLDQTGVPDGVTLVVAFSGGPDSSALLAGLSELRERRNLSLIAAHVNHGIRPESSAADQDAAAAVAKSLGVDFIAAKIDVPVLSADNGVSIESAARTFRYKELEAIATDNNAYGVVTGHTEDDQAETVLQHAARGSGLKGISGMRFTSRLNIAAENVKLRILRPMLDISRVLCVEYCECRGLSPVFDESNSSREYTRNKIRLDVLPQLNEAIPEASRALARLAMNASDDLEIIDWVVELHLSDAKTGNGLYVRDSVSALPPSLTRRLIMKAYDDNVGHSLDLERTHVIKMQELLNGQSGTSIELPNKAVFFVDKDEFGFRMQGDDDCPYPSIVTAKKLETPGITDLSDGVAVHTEVIDRPEHLDAGGPNVTFASPELISRSLNLRSRKNGDRFQPLGMVPKVKLQDFFVGAGVPERWRDRVPLVDSDQGIVWVAGYRLAEWAKVLPEHDRVTRFEIVGTKIAK